MATSPIPPTVEWLSVVVRELQVLAGLLVDGSPTTIVAQCHLVAARIPATAARAEQLVVGALLRDGLVRVRAALHWIDAGPTCSGVVNKDEFERTVHAANGRGNAALGQADAVRGDTG